MSKNKRYYWLKLPKDFFEDKAIKRLRQIAGGDTYTIIYLKMLLKSMEDDGKLFYEGIEDTICNEIALDINENADDVQVTMNYLEKKGLLVVTDSEVKLPRLIDMVGSESTVTERVRKHRESQKLLQCNASALQGNTNETKCNTEKEIEIDTDIEIEKEKSREDIDTDIDVDINTICSELNESPSEQVVISLPLNDKSTRDITESEVETYQELYQNVNVTQELKNMLGWLNANPTKRKTKKGIDRFVNGWLSRKQDSGGNSSNSRQQKESETWWF